MKTQLTPPMVTQKMVSFSDIIGITYGSLFDATQTKVTDMDNGKTLVKITACMITRIHIQAKW